MIDRVLFRMPSSLEYFFPAASVVQNYIGQQYVLVREGQKKIQSCFTVEFGDESEFFFASMFPRMELAMREQDEIKRSDWDCVLDMRDTSRVLALATPTNKHITEAWSTMFGCCAPKVPILGAVGIKCVEPAYDFLIDANLQAAEDMNQKAMNAGYSTVVARVSGTRISYQFELLSKVRNFVGPRSESTYLAASIGRGLVEVWSKTIPFWFLNKPSNGNLRSVISESPSANILLAQAKEIYPLQKVA